jgi:hypothetical protein
MLKYWAKVDCGKVINVVCSAEEDIIYAVSDIPGYWIETFIEPNGEADKRYNYAGIGSEYNSEDDFFCKSPPYKSWVLNNKKIWYPPVEQPVGNYKWDEATLGWKEV